MPDIDLSLTGSQIDSALTSVHNPDTTPISSSTKMVTSGGVHTALNDIQFTNLNSNLVSTDLSSGNNNTTIPTTQAVANLVSGSSISLARYSCTITNQTGNLFVFPFVEDYDPDGIGSVSSGVITLGAGNYFIHFSSSIEAASRKINIEKDNAAVIGLHNTAGHSGEHAFSCGAVVSDSTSFTIRALAYYGTSGYLNASLTYFNIIKFG